MARKSKQKDTKPKRQYNKKPIVRKTISEEVLIMSTTPFQTLKNKTEQGTVSSVIGYFPLIGTDKGIKFRNEDGTPQDTTYTINQINTVCIYSLFAYKLGDAKKKGGKFSPANFTNALADNGYAGYANICNEADVFTKRSFDRNPVIFRIANGTFDDGVYENEIVGALMTYNALENSVLLKMIEDGNVANLIQFGVYTPEALEIYFKLKHDIPPSETPTMLLKGRIQNGLSGTVSFNFNGVIISSNGKYKYILPTVDENGGYVNLRGRNRHMGWLDEGLEKFVEAVDSISKINYYETLQSITIEGVWRIFETARTILVNDKKANMDSEKSEIALGILQTRCKVAQFTNALQVFNEATILAGEHGKGKIMNDLLDKVFDLIFCV